MRYQGEYLRDLRSQLNLKQREIAKIMGTSSDYVSMLENNRKKLTDNFRIKYYEVLKTNGIKVNLADIFLNTLRPFQSSKLDIIAKIS